MHNNHRTKIIIQILKLIPNLTSKRDRLEILKLALTLLNAILEDEEQAESAPLGHKVRRNQHA